jgi:uncharacterized protein (DUF697 family)
MRKQFTDFAKKKLKNTIMPDSFKKKGGGKSDRSRHADTVVRNHVIWSMGASYLIPLPIADVFAVSALQLDMIRQLCRVYDIDFAETQGKAIVSSLTTSTMARAGARSLIKLIPGIGTIIGGITVSVFNGASTYALGEVFKKHFDLGGTILDFDVERLKKQYREKFEKGRKVAEQLKKEVDTDTIKVPVEDSVVEKATKATRSEPASDPTRNPDETSGTDTVLSKIRELGKMRTDGLISEDEFESMKKKLIKGF